MNSCGMIRAGMFRYSATIFLAAFLLFEVQPLFGKHVLPWFGGTPAVWTTCMLFYQALLLAGYCYAHWLDSRASRRIAGWLHASLLVLSVGLLVCQALWWKVPLLPGEGFEPRDSLQPVGRILLLLTIGVGLPFLLLSTTSPLLQAWFRRAHPGLSPYRLYGLSNAGSLLALVSYPFVIEPLLPLGAQALVWSCGYGLFALLVVGLAIHTAASQPAVERRAAGDGAGWRLNLLWLGLAACGSAMLLAITNQICQEMAVIPFLWILPLALYLLTFILAFAGDRWHSRRIFGPALVAVSLVTTVVIYLEQRSDVVSQLIWYSLCLFVGCMVCHGELARHKPHPRHLTGFYLMLSVGGALGGVFVGLLAPLLFSAFWELHLSLFACAALFWLVLVREPQSWLHTGRRTARRVMFTAWIVVLGLALLMHTQTFQSRSVYGQRNFYGIIRVHERHSGDPALHHHNLMHGLIIHGFQLVAEAGRRIPTAYYGRDSGLGLALLDHPRRRAAWPDGDGSLRIGVIGLGVGTIAAYGRPGDVIRFYEINPEVIRLARGEQSFFSYLADSRAEIEIVPGDARLSLERELESGEPRQFDVLVVDAFSSDSIPVHLLTVEAFGLYLRHLDPCGILAIHITNRHLDLARVTLRLALHWNMPAALLRVPDRGHTYTSEWMLITRNEVFWDLPIMTEEVIRPRPGRTDLPVSLWTDDFNNLFETLK